MAAVWIAAVVAAGCGSPNRANIELRRQNQQLQAQVNQLQVQHLGDERAIAGLRDRTDYLPSLPAARLEQLFTTHGLEFGRLTGGADLDASKPGDEGLVVYIVPIDSSGDKLKAAGTFDIDAFDLADTRNTHLGHWHFDLRSTKAAWADVLLQYGYVFTCPWQQRVPQHRDLTLKVTFFDELTQTPFTAQTVIHVNLPPQT